MKKIIYFIDNMVRSLNYLSPLIDLVIRIYIGLIFWRAGIVKFTHIESTIWLFTHAYQAPILSPVNAAYLSTWSELIFSAGLILGLCSRLSAFVLFMLNIIAVFSYPTWYEASMQWHVVWGILLLVPFLHGPGKLSLDYLIWKKIKHDY